MNIAQLSTHLPLTGAQLWAVLKEFHMGEFVERVFRQHHLIQASVARAMGIKPQGISNMFARTTITDETLQRLSQASGVDFFGLARREKARLQGVDLPMSMAMEPAPVYGRGSANDLVVHLDDFDEATQLKILRFLQQQPKRQR